MTLQDQFRQFALYNRWANKCLYTSASFISDEDRKADRGAFFQSLHGTLNHVLVADKSWRDRLEARPSELGKSVELDTLTHPDFDDLTKARKAEDEALIACVFALDEAALSSPFAYETSVGESVTQVQADALAHIFNHQTHHRGQAHDLIQQINQKPPVLDLLAYQRYVAPGDAP